MSSNILTREDTVATVAIDTSTAATRSRDYQIDAMRALLVLLGIPYHAAMFYQTGETWSIAGDDRWEGLRILAEVIHSFRMQAFFLIAGYFSALVLSRRSTGTWLWSRFMQIGLPLVTATLLVMPLVMLIEEAALANRSGADFSVALARTLALVMTPGPHWLGHLWFLSALLMYCILLAAVWRWVKVAPFGLLNAAFARYPFVFSAIVLLGVIVYAQVTGVPSRLLGKVIPFDPRTLSFFTTVVTYLPMFVIGIVLYNMPQAFREFRQFRWSVALLALLATIAYCVLSGGDTVYFRAAARGASAACGLLTSSLILSVADIAVKRDTLFVRKIVDSALIIYIVHFPIVFAIGYMATFVGIPPILEFLLVACATFALSWVVYLAISGVPTVHFLFTGRSRPR